MLAIPYLWPEPSWPSRGSKITTRLSTRALKQTHPAGESGLVPLSCVNLGTLITSLTILWKIEKLMASLSLSWSKFSKGMYIKSCSNSINESFYCPVVVSMCPI